MYKLVPNTYANRLPKSTNRGDVKVGFKCLCTPSAERDKLPSSRKSSQVPMHSILQKGRICQVRACQVHKLRDPPTFASVL